MALPVSDSLSNVNEQIEAAAKVLGRSKHAHIVFGEIYNGKKKLKTVQELSDRTLLTRKQVLTQGKRLADHHIIDQLKINGDTCYQKIPFFHQNKNKILGLASSPKKMAGYPTKRKRDANSIITVRLDKSNAKAKRVSVDDIDSFAGIRKVFPSGLISQSISENDFKNGVKSILGEEGKFADWGGEKNDLYTTRLTIFGKRHFAAFAFKGPGTRGTLVPGKLGKNGDQIQRLFQTDADLFMIQYWNQISQSVIEQMDAFAIAKSVMTQRKILYGVIDGIDSKRLVIAYSHHFKVRDHN